MKHSAKNTEMIVAVLAGIALGTTVGLLYAPDSGKQTRDKIKMEAERTTLRLENAAAELKGKLLDVMENSGDQLGYMIGSAIAKGTITSMDMIKILEAQIKKLTSKDHGKSTNDVT